MIPKRSTVECQKILRAYDERGQELSEKDIRNQATFLILDILPLQRKITEEEKKNGGGAVKEIQNTMKSRLYFKSLSRVIQYRETKESIKLTLETYHNE